MEKEFVSMELIMVKDIVSMKRLKDKSFVSEDFPIPNLGITLKQQAAV